MTWTRWLDPRQQAAWRAYLQMQSRLAAELNRRLQASHGLSLADYDVLVRLSEADHGRLRPFQLEQDLQWEQSRLAHQLTRMQRRGLLLREKCAEDGRGSFVVLTDAGRAAIERAAPAHVEAVRTVVFDGLSAADVAQLERLAATVLARLDAASAGRDTNAGSTPRGQRAEPRTAGAARLIRSAAAPSEPAPRGHGTPS
jgi:DNA-binding MarR family transcriptional regulator